MIRMKTAIHCKIWDCKRNQNNKKDKHKISHWLTAGVLQSINCRDALYRKLLSTARTTVQHYLLELNLDTYKKFLEKTFKLCHRWFRNQQFWQLRISSIISMPTLVLGFHQTLTKVTAKLYIRVSNSVLHVPSISHVSNPLMYKNTLMTSQIKPVAVRMAFPLNSLTE